jgi:hypothetical protein
MTRHLSFVVLGLILNLGGACGSSPGVNPGGACDQNRSCPAGQLCITGGTCAQNCEPDGGTSCPNGKTCQTESGFCVVPACLAIQVMVCR